MKGERGGPERSLSATLCGLQFSKPDHEIGLDLSDVIARLRLAPWLVGPLKDAASIEGWDSR